MKMPGLHTIDVCVRLRRACDAAGGQKAFAAQHGVSGAYVNDVLQSRRDPGESILRALGLRRVVRYVETRQMPDSGSAR